METCRTRSGEKHGGEGGSAISRKLETEVGQSSGVELLGSGAQDRETGITTPLCGVKATRSRQGGEIILASPSQQPRVIARSTAEEKGLQSIGLILGLGLNSTDATLPRFPFCIEFPGGNYETRPRRRGMIFVTFERRGIGCVIGAGGGGDASRDGDKLSR